MDVWQHMDGKDSKINMLYQREITVGLNISCRKKGLYKNSDKEGERYGMLNDGPLNINIFKRIMKGTLINCRIKGEISNVRYHRLNHRTIRQEEDKFENKGKNQMQQVTFVIPFTKLDVMVETKMENDNIFLVMKMNMFHCHVKPSTCLFLLHKK